MKVWKLLVFLFTVASHEKKRTLGASDVFPEGTPTPGLTTFVLDGFLLTRRSIR